MISVGVAFLEGWEIPSLKLGSPAFTGNPRTFPGNFRKFGIFHRIFRGISGNFVEFPENSGIPEISGDSPEILGHFREFPLKFLENFGNSRGIPGIFLDNPFPLIPIDPLDASAH